MKVLHTIAAAAAAGGLLLAVAPLAGAAPRNSDCGGGSGLKVVGLTANDQLICFRANNPSVAKTIGTIKGLQNGDDLVGIDYRPKNRTLYALSDDGTLYTVNDRTARAKQVAQIQPKLRGGGVGFDFNPAADALRILGERGENLRYTIAADPKVTVVDGPLSNPALPAKPPAPKGPLAEDVAGAAYTNNDNNMDTPTTLFDIDAAMDRVAIQSPANAGTLAPTGKLGVKTSTAVGFDIYSRLSDGKAVDNKAFASMRVGDRSGFYSIDLLTGDADKLGDFGRRSVIGIAVPLNQ